MCNPLQCRIVASSIIALLSVNGRAVSVCAADESVANAAIYHAEPGHLWNRLYAAFFMRIGPDGVTYGRDRLEPLLWQGTKYLLGERSNKRAAAVLDEFLKDSGEKLIDDPLKRAMLQRDLWLVFNWLEGSHETKGASRLDADTVRMAQERLRHPLARVIRQLALTSQEIQELPDNYEAAIASNEFALRFDATKPDQPYLPPNLFSADGPWVSVGRVDGVTGPQHLNENRSYGFNNSVFLVFLRLRDGRAATAEYLKELPPFPDGTEVALVRRALLIDTSQRVVPSPLTESIQLRIGDAGIEFHLSRQLLFDGKAGGLRSLGLHEKDFKTGFGAGRLDEIEEIAEGKRAFSSALRPIRQQCSGCHNRRRNPDFVSGSDFGQPHPWKVKERSVADIGTTAVHWKENRLDWAALRMLMSE